MTNQNKTPELAATSVEGSNIKSHAPQFTVNDVLRKSILWRMETPNTYERHSFGAVPHNALITHVMRQGFTASQARRAIESLAADGLASFDVARGRVVVREVRA